MFLMGIQDVSNKFGILKAKLLFTLVKCFEVFQWQSNDVLARLLSCKRQFPTFLTV